MVRVLSYRYEVVRTGVDVERCESVCEKRVLEEKINIPGEYEEYRVVAATEIDEAVQRGSGFRHEEWDLDLLLEKGGERYVAIVTGRSGWTMHGNAIECKNDAGGLSLVPACETGSGYAEVDVEVVPWDEYVKRASASPEEAEEWFDPDYASGESLAERLEEIVRDELERHK